MGVINRKSRFAPNGCRSGFLALLLIGRKRAGELIRLIRPPRLSKRIPFGNNASVRDMWCWCCDATARREARRDAREREWGLSKVTRFHGRAQRVALGGISFLAPTFPHSRGFHIPLDCAERSWANAIDKNVSPDVCIAKGRALCVNRSASPS